MENSDSVGHAFPNSNIVTTLHKEKFNGYLNGLEICFYFILTSWRSNPFHVLHVDDFDKNSILQQGKEIENVIIPQGVDSRYHISALLFSSNYKKGMHKLHIMFDMCFSPLNVPESYEKCLRVSSSAVKGIIKFNWTSAID